MINFIAEQWWTWLLIVLAYYCLWPHRLKILLLYIKQNKKSSIAMMEVVTVSVIGFISQVFALISIITIAIHGLF